MAAVKTLYDARAMVTRWLFGETVDPDLKDDCVNDAIESLWQSLILASLENFVGGPVSLPVASGDERLEIDSIANPTVAPTISQTTSGALAQHTVYSCYTLATESGSETLPSPTDTTVVVINKIATMASPSFVAGAFGYNCYMGTASDRMGKVNTDPVAFGTSQSEPVTGAVLVPSAPGVPTVNTTCDDLFYIRRLESPGAIPGTYRRWESGDLDSLLMSRAAESLAINSPYQTYAWDLINGNQVEIRPRAAGAVDARYFYIKKPRRLAFDGSPMPFRNLPATEFIRTFALARLFSGLREWKSVEGWNEQAEAARAVCVKAVQAQNIPRNQRVVPFMYA